MKLSASAIDPKLVNEGEWIKDIPEFEDLELHVRGLNNPDYRRVQAKKFQLLPRGLRAKPTPEVSDRIQTELLVETCLLGWKNLSGDDDKPIEFSKEKAMELLKDPQYRAFREAVAWAAAVVGAERDEDREGSAKNS
jgi:hypothetical protein